MSSKYTSTHYHNYLQLDKILGAQELRSAADNHPAHDEMLFIVVHQAYELWFRQIIHELESIAAIMKEKVDERQLQVVVHRLDRVTEIQKLLIQQITVLETLQPMEFLEFRDYLFPASGFQSFQFRTVETLLGLREQDRTGYNNSSFLDSLEPKQQETIRNLMNQSSLFEIIENWLERTPFIKDKAFSFVEHYEQAVKKMFEKERSQIGNAPSLSDEEKALRLRILEGSEKYFGMMTSREAYDAARERGEVRLSYTAAMAALFIHLYHEEPILSQPYQLLDKIVEMDELFTTWRYRHAQMVMRMLGRKMGTGGSSGHDYLKETAAKHQVFRDFHNISTMLVPKSYIPELPAGLKKQMSFYFG